MKQNMGTLDRIIRISIAVGLSIAFFLNLISGILAIVLLVLAIVFVITSFVSFCPLYYPFGITTKKEKPKQ